MRKVDKEMFNARNDLSRARCAHEGSAGTGESAQVVTRKNLAVASKNRTLTTGFTVQRHGQPARNSRQRVGWTCLSDELPPKSNCEPVWPSDESLGWQVKGSWLEIASLGVLSKGFALYDAGYFTVKG